MPSWPGGHAGAVPEAVIFDLDGVLLDSEQRWNDGQGGTRHRDRRHLARRGGAGDDGHELAASGRPICATSSACRGRPSASTARSCAAWRRATRRGCRCCPARSSASAPWPTRWPLGLASSSNRELIDLFLDVAGVRDLFRATVSSEEVARGKPAPDVYLEAAEGVGVDPRRCVAIEDSENGMRAAHAAGMTIVAVPNPHYPPDGEALALAAATVEVPGEITPELVASAAG